MVFHLRRRPDRLPGDHPRTLGIEHRTDPLAHQLTLLLSGARRRVRDGSLIQRQAVVTDMLDDDLGHQLASREVAQALKALQRHHQRQQMLIRPGPVSRPRDLIRRGLIHQALVR